MMALLYFRGLMARQTGRLILTLILALITIFAGVGLLGVSGWFITATAVAGAGAAFNLFAPSSMVRGLSLIRIVARYAERLMGHDGTLRMLADMRAWLLETMFPKLPLARTSPRHGDVVSRMTADIDALNTAFLVVISPVVAAIAIWIVLTLVLAFQLPQAALAFAILFGVAVLLVPALLIVASRRPGAVITTRLADLRSAVLDGVEGHVDLVAFAARDRAGAAFDRHLQDLSDARRRLTSLNAAASALVQFLGGVTALAVLWFGIQAYQAGQLGGPVLVGLVLATLGSYEAAAAVTRGLAKFSTAAASAERLRALAEAQPRVTDPASPVALSAATDLSFQNVTFAYPDGTPVLRDASFELPAGRMLAIQGPSGAGKSTILQLALRLYDPDAGAISLGGTDLRDLRQSDIHRSIAYLGQSAPIFLDTIRGNLRIANPNADDDQIWQALERAKIADFVRSLPDGLSTMMWEGGASLSTGQARRLCLARALLSAARIVVLDEPTSGLDRGTEYAFLLDIPQALTGRSVLLVTHAEIPPGLMPVMQLVDGRLRSDQAAISRS